MFKWLQQFESETYCLELADRGATENELLEVEQIIGIALPPSYKAFLKLWNGGALGGQTVFSTQVLVDGLKNYGFSSYTGQIERVGKNYNYVYRAKPAHLLAYANLDFSSDLYCFDTRPTTNNEYPICLYDHEISDLDELLTVKYPSFEAFVLEKVYHLTDDLEYFMADDSNEDEDYEKAEAVLERWQQTIREKLIERGADLSDLWWPKW